MPSAGNVFVGFGFGAIQAGLFLYEAQRSRNFRRLVTAEVVPEAVAELRNFGGRYRVNIAHADRIESAEVGPVEVEDPAVAADRGRLIAAIAESSELATAVPSVKQYVSEGPGSIHRLLAEGLRRKAAAGGPPAVLYAAENHNRAAELLAEAVLGEIPEEERAGVRTKVRFLNTVVGKMSGARSDPTEARALGLATITPDSPRAFLVEAFNRILITRIDFPESCFRRGIEVFEEKPDLLPFEEAKLYGHNATHALAAYVAAAANLKDMCELRSTPGMKTFLHAASLEESGAALRRKHAGRDPLFTTAGYQAYAEDLLERMTNPFLKDTVERVGRDPRRKLGWEDRLVGTMRLALSQGVVPRRYAFGAAAALFVLDPRALEPETPLAPLLSPLWQDAPRTQEEEAQVLRLLEDARIHLRAWRRAGGPDLAGFWGGKT